MSFVVNVRQDFKEFTIPLQSSEPKIHVLFTKSSKLVKDLSRIMKPKNITMTERTILLPPDELIKIIRKKEKSNVTFYSSALISTHLGLPTVLIFLIFVFVFFFRNGIKFPNFSEICSNFPSFSWFFKIYYIFLPVSYI